MWMLSAEPHLGLLDGVVRSAERLCKGELCCLEPKRNVSALCLLFRIYNRVDHLMFVSASFCGSL